MNELRVVIDTNVIVSAVLLPRSVPRQALDAAQQRGRLLMSAETIMEIDEVLRRPKFEKYVEEELRLEFLAGLVRDATIVSITDRVDLCRDARDNKFLEVALNGSASHLISGDEDLLVLHPFRGTDILRPHAFLDSVADKEQ